MTAKASGPDILPGCVRPAMIGSMEMPFEREDVASIVGGVFDLDAKLARIGEDVGAIRRLLEEDDGEEEEAEEG